MKAWVLDDDAAIRWVLERALSQQKVDVTTFMDARSLLDALANEEPDVLLTDVRMPGMDGLALADSLRQSHPKLPIIIMTAHSDLDTAVSAYQTGAFEYLPKPFDLDEVVALLKRAVQDSAEPDQAPSLPSNLPELIGEAPAMQTVFRAIGRLSRSSVSVLINGQSGTGKELVARALHRHSPRGKGPFVAINMAAIPADLIESELFGHEKGAFTGAAGRREGRFEQADGGTLFLDEIGDMPLSAQTRLLRVLQEGQFYRVGGAVAVKVDVRIIAATHQDLEKGVEQGRFREDLFHRLNVIRVQLPPLAERREDIPKLAEYFLGRIAAELQTPERRLHPDTLKLMTKLPWPGNVRQLENTCRYLTVMAAGQEILPADLPDSLDPKVATLGWVEELKVWADQLLTAGNQGVASDAQRMLEEALIEVALRHSKGHKQDAAKCLGWGRNTLTRKLSGQD
ncbi:nitrogen regulation protein NR(I) [Gallaecimonas xiamenensis]|uniref:DNA-binding transcriptional regulator NtrC n=1 Tax=Gallaecimonas xiamenensis 3-C-1 TaxID=745411 RepID=K2JD71_9GAMM|nr:nitrogen regulation protein NR(I) [Gallaecimonas xiamenensis]EKE73053.1 nitrogen regulation protein NR(I) [Gallaecimonas xiamenensis 3-C-1]